MSTEKQSDSIAWGILKAILYLWLIVMGINLVGAIIAIGFAG